MKNDRLFQMMNILIEKGFVTAKELSERFEVSVRTIYRDVEVLSVSGVPLYTIQGKGGGIALMEGYSIDKTMLSDIEQKQVLMALESVQALTGTQENASLEKLKNVFHKDSDNWIEMDFSSWENTSSERKIFAQIKESILEKKVLKILYHNSNGETTERIVKPHKLVYKSNSWYLSAYCLMRKAERFFKVRRIEYIDIISDVEAIEYKSKLSNDSKVEQYISEEKTKENKVSISYAKNSVYLLEITMEIEKKMAFRVMDEFRNGKIIEQENNYKVVTKLPDEPWIYQYLLGYGETLRVLEPLKVKEELKRQIHNLDQYY